ncbi:hotdog fold thioesterase [Kribbia dieselivorans]|uniref:hotdog fold thioesterase n=1 Tax=Kribbia dieselivorans TaxID=331526 RepID=UPI000838ECC4|nr:hotdog fold thioesterase [Kribbia dieselivorans]
MTEPTTAAADPSTNPEIAAHTEHSRGTLIERMEIEFLEISDEQLVARMPVNGNTQPYGLLHGGASVVLAETLGSMGAARHAGAGKVAVGVDINATHHRAARSGWVTGVATPIQLGRSLVAYEVVISDEDGKRVCTSRITCLIRDNAPGA